MSKWTDEDRAYLQAMRGKLDSDDIHIKEQIKKKLMENKYIIHLLQNKELEEKNASADEYFGINLLPYYIMEPTQTHTNNFICFETDFDELMRYNKSMKMQEVVFNILCHEKTIVDTETGLARHDPLAALIIREFNETNVFGHKIRLISNKSGVVDNHYPCRTLVFEQKTENSLTQTDRSGVIRTINKDIVT